MLVLRSIRPATSGVLLCTTMSIALVSVAVYSQTVAPSTPKPSTSATKPASQAKSKTDTPTKAQGKPKTLPSTTTATKLKPVVQKVLTLTGDFSPLSDEGLTVALAEVVVTAADQTILADSRVSAEAASLLTFTGTSATIVYTPGTSDPQVVYLGAKNKSLIPFNVTTASNQRQVVISGPFCSDGSKGLCSLKLQDLPKSFITSSDGSMSYAAAITSLSSNRASVSFYAPTDFKPALLTILGTSDGKVQPSNFAYVAAPPSVTRNMVYESFGTLCKTDDEDCLANTVFSAPDAPTATVLPLALHGNHLFVSITTDSGAEPEILTASPKTSAKKTGKDVVLLRRVTRPASDQSLVDVEATPMDQETVRRNFGERIAQHYFAEQLTLTNRTDKKLQVDKAAIWFDADFRAVGGAKNEVNSRAAFYAATAYTFFPPSVYPEPFEPYSKGDVKYCLKHSDPVEETESPKESAKLTKENAKLTEQDAKQKSATAKVETFVPDPVLPNILQEPTCLQTTYRFGIEQNVALRTIDLNTALAAFDYSTEKTDRALRFVELIGATLLPISSGTIVAQVHNTAFRDSVAIFTGTFLPGYRALALDPQAINRLRSNLLQQMMQDSIQVTPRGHVDTIVLIPRDGILSFRGRDQAVVVDRLVNVHVDPDVINGLKDATVAADQIDIGYTTDQVRAALGEPPNTSTDATSGQLTYTYAKGAYKTVVFNKDGKVISWTSRSLDEQIALVATLADAVALLNKQKLSYTRLSLLNGESILVDIPGAMNVPLFDKQDKYASNYTLLYPAIKALIPATSSSETAVAFQAALAAKYIGTGYYPPLPTPVGGKMTFTMPDIVGGYVVATLDSTGKIVNSIAFTGSKPASAK